MTSGRFPKVTARTLTSLGVYEVAEALHISPATVTRYVRYGIIDVLQGDGKRGSPWRLCPASVELLREFLEHPIRLKLKNKGKMT